MVDESPQIPQPAPASGSGRQTLLLGVALVLLVLVGTGVVTWSGNLGGRSAAGPSEAAAGVAGGTILAERGDPEERFRLPDRKLQGFDGAPDVALETLRGGPVVINFWATWCAPCVKEMPAFQQVAAEVEGRVVFLGVNVQDAPVNATSFAEQLEISYPMATDPRGAFWQEVGGFGMPTTLLVNSRGMVVYRHTGALEADELRELMRQRLGVVVDSAGSVGGWGRAPVG